MEKYTKFTDQGTGIQPFLQPKARAVTDGARRALLVLKNWVLGPVLLLLRLPVLLIIALWFVVMTGISFIIPVPVLRRGFERYTSALGCRVALLLAGFWWISTEHATLLRGRNMAAVSGMPGGNLRSGDLIVANHVSYLDILYLQFRFAPTFVHAYSTRPGNKDVDPGEAEVVPWFVALFRALRAPLIEAPESAKLVQLNDILVEARERKRGPVVVFPEGTTSNGQSIISFTPILDNIYVPKGAHVQLLGFKYPFEDFSPIYSCGNAVAHVLRLLCQPFNQMEVSYLRQEEAIPLAETEPRVAFWGTRLAQMLRVRRTRLTAVDKVAFLQYFGSTQRYKRD